MERINGKRERGLGVTLPDGKQYAVKMMKMMKPTIQQQ